ncbi:MAG: MerR family DNA-binding transcriptional regulator [bacterium]
MYRLLTISQASKMLGVSVQTLRRWDDSGKLSSIRKKATGNRYYARNDIYDFIKNNIRDLLVKLAKAWVVNNVKTEFHPDFYCSSSSIFQARLSKLESELGEIRELGKIFPLITAITGEIGNNSFDHNLGNWPDVPGIFFAYSLEKKKIVLADRGQGILATLKKVKPKLKNHQDALMVAFTEIISGRAPESRGNGLKFVRQVVADNKISLFFQTGNAQLEIRQQDCNLNIKKSKNNFRGCLAIIKF